ncbi:hydroxyisourate hydrolase [Arthrobacter sp. Sa2CUA1]|uniref:5-hydroxyisourate hydrolase n=1 Tax=Arthrobacter gallicola TaxID=2762225 RepID=A0ABR8UR90_9MICC|nr:hydroxyisourate hydrolase [Arthrobacter gallicola]MBD7995078.1 hydroxyisourate hydrolase [Arthrobacter gallicola]
MTTSYITTHVLDTAAGKPAAGVPVRLSSLQDDTWTHLADGQTDADGRVKNLGPEALPSGTYRLEFTTADYFARHKTPSFFPEVLLTFSVDSGQAHYHVPLLLSPYSFSSYRGS